MTVNPDEELAELRQKLAEAQRLIPESFYGDRELPFRMERLVSVWQRAAMANEKLEEKLAQAQAALPDAETWKAAQDFITSAAKHFSDPEATRCKDCTSKLFLYEARSVRPIEEIRAALKAKHALGVEAGGESQERIRR